MKTSLRIDRDLGALVLLAAIWGSSYLFIRVAVPALGPFGLSWVRVFVGGCGLLAFVLATSGRSGIPRISPPFFVLAAINSMVPFVLINFAELHITASLAAILNATTPLFAATLVLILTRSKPSPQLILGLLLGVCGVGVLVGWSPVPRSGLVVLAMLAMLVASCGYAGAGVYTKAKLVTFPANSLALGQQLAASILMFPYLVGSVAAGSTDTTPSLKVGLAGLALGLLCTSAAYPLYFHLIKSVGPVRTSLVTFLIPIFGIFWSWLFLDEVVKPVMIIGLALILASIRLVNRPSTAPVPKAAGATG
jgi:drug/metabolite transporter (DMT)-like permease